MSMSKLIKTSKQLSAEVLVYPDSSCRGARGQREEGLTFFLLSPHALFASFPTSIPNSPGATHVLDMSLNIVPV